MYRLPFADHEFNTIIIDDVLRTAHDPVRALEEVSRVLRSGGRMFVLESLRTNTSADVQASLAAWCQQSGLRLSPARLVPKKDPRWLVSVATLAVEQLQQQRTVS
jgi:ubiquinone/menaquinone biosynthesis C-methylase UbiE